MEEAIIQACKVQDGIKSIGQNLKWTGGFLGKFSLIKADPYKKRGETRSLFLKV